MLTKSERASSSWSDTNVAPPAAASILGRGPPPARVEHRHPEADGPPGDRLADPPEADDAERRAMHVRAQERQRAPGPPAAGPDEAVALGDAAGPAISRPNARSAVVSVRTSGVLPTAMPRRVQAGTSTLS